VTDASGCVETETVTFSIGWDCVGFWGRINEDPIGSGILLASPKGGLAPYTYEWTTGETTQTITTNSTGSYYVTMTDANGCLAGDGIEF